MRFAICILPIVLAVWSCQSETKPGEHSHGGASHSHAPGSAAAKTPGEILDKKVVAATSVSPEFVQLATNVEIIPDIRESVKSVGVLTHEGTFGPLLFAEKIRSFFIELKPGMFLSEHPHPSESLVYTVSGRWVLCSEGKRQVMEAGSTFHFGSNMPTGWEAPFAEGALLYVVKSKEEGESYELYMKGLKEMVETLDQERANGNPFYYNELDQDHPAILFARSVNPDFEEVLKNIKY